MSDHEQQQGGDEETLHDGQELGGGWIAYRDDEGRFYYYSGDTGETQWERPEEAVALGQATPRDEGERAGGDQRPAYDYQNNAETPDTATPVRSPLDDVAGAESASPGDGPGGSKEGGGGGDADGGSDGITKSPPIRDHVGIPQSPAAEAAEGASPRVEPTERQDEPMTEETAAVQSEEELHDGQELGDGWMAYKDDEGRFYYYNGESGETQWERPEIALKAATETASGDVANKEVKVEPVSEARETQAQETQSEEAATAEQKAAVPSKAQAEPQKEEEKPAEVDITPEQFLAQPDAIMEPGVLDRIDDLVRDQGAGSALPFAAKTLAAGYGGDTSVCGLLGLWLAELTAMKGGPPDGASAAANGQAIGMARPGRSGRLFEEGADRARDAAEGVIGRLVKERFKDGDSIMRLSKKQVCLPSRICCNACNALTSQRNMTGRLRRRHDRIAPMAKAPDRPERHEQGQHVLYVLPHDHKQPGSSQGDRQPDQPERLLRRLPQHAPERADHRGEGGSGRVRRRRPWRGRRRRLEGRRWGGDGHVRGRPAQDLHVDVVPVPVRDGGTARSHREGRVERRRVAVKARGAKVEEA